MSWLPRLSQPEVPVKEVPTNMTPAVIACVYFFPLGILAIRSANMSKEAHSRKEVDMAIRYSNKARYLSFAAVSMFAFLVALIIIFLAVLRHKYK